MVAALESSAVLAVFSLVSTAKTSWTLSGCTLTDAEPETVRVFSSSSPPSSSYPCVSQEKGSPQPGTLSTLWALVPGFVPLITHSLPPGL